MRPQLLTDAAPETSNMGGPLGYMASCSINDKEVGFQGIGQCKNLLKLVTCYPRTNCFLRSLVTAGFNWLI